MIKTKQGYHLMSVSRVKALYNVRVVLGASLAGGCVVIASMMPVRPLLGAVHTTPAAHTHTAPHARAERSRIARCAHKLLSTIHSPATFASERQITRRQFLHVFERTHGALCVVMTFPSLSLNTQISNMRRRTSIERRCIGYSGVDVF